MYVKLQAKLTQQRSQNIYQIAQNKYWFALIPLSISLSWPANILS